MLSEKGNWRSEFRGNEGDFSVGHLESEMPINHQSGHAEVFGWIKRSEVQEVVLG